MAERGMESVLFRGKKLMPETNGERLDGVAEQLVREHHRRIDRSEERRVGKECLL